MDFRNIHNYYEHLVLDYMKSKSPEELGDSNPDFLQDVACYALSKLPARYVRHEIDMAFYLEASERKQMETDVKNVVDEALVYIKENFNKDDRYSSSTNADNE